MEGRRKRISILVTGILIIISAIFCRMNMFYVLPIVISLFVMAYQSEANRYAVLAGSLNSLVYTAVFISFGIYGSAIQAALISFPIQLITFFKWKKRAYKHTVMFKKMSNPARFILFGFLTAIWIVLSVIFVKMDYQYGVLDSAVTLLGFIGPFLTMLAYVEYTYLSLFSAAFSILLNIQMVANDYTKIPYLIYGIYSAVCMVIAFFNVKKYYKEQQGTVKNVNLYRKQNRQKCMF